jgi:hypothetical protein
LTDPESHKHRQFDDVYVTDAEQGESSFASSSGVSCCDSDDDDESTSSDDDDDDDSDFQDDSLLSNEINIKKWTLPNGYNMTTFDQVLRGTWTKDQPLPLPKWSKITKAPLVIDNVSFSNSQSNE